MSRVCGWPQSVPAGGAGRDDSPLPQTTVDKYRKKKGFVIRGASSGDPPLLGGPPTSLSFKNTDLKQQISPAVVVHSVNPNPQEVENSL